MKWFIVLILMFAVMPALAIDDEAQLDDPVLQARFDKLSDELRCLVCQNNSIADSTADLARDLRNQVRAMLLAGNTDREILDYMVARYGDFVRYRPGFNSRTWLLWIGPFVLMGTGLLIAGFVIAGRARVSRESPVE